MTTKKILLAIFIGVFLNILFYIEVGFLCHASGHSMEPTIHDKEILLVKRSSSIKDGDVVSVDMDKYSIVKRVVAMYPDFVKVSNDGIFVSKDKKNGYVSVKKDEVYLLGDNLVVSNDSRFFGPVKKNKIEGIVIW